MKKRGLLRLPTQSNSLPSGGCGGGLSIQPGSGCISRLLSPLSLCPGPAGDLGSPRPFGLCGFYQLRVAGEE